jgi:hypothetical protein
MEIDEIVKGIRREKRGCPGCALAQSLLIKSNITAKADKI